ncbi:MAG: hypothetical protein F6J86_22850, partial [Symploca sp. SIO1B1]|nr:hypothetical protein [Symploca sp. SIO1B1]
TDQTSNGNQGTIYGAGTWKKEGGGTWEQEKLDFISPAPSKEQSPETTSEGESEQPEKPEEAGKLLKQGPKGSSIKGTSFDIQPTEEVSQSKITSISVWHAWAIGNIIVNIQSSANSYVLRCKQPPSPEGEEFNLEAGDYLTKVSGTWGRQAPGYPKEEIITLQFHTYKGVTSKVFGGGSGKQEVEPFSLEAPEGQEIIGFFGVYGGRQDVLTSLGIYLRPVEEPTPVPEEPTTTEQEQTTTDKEEPTTAEQEQITTDKEEPTTAEQEQTTTDKEEPTTAEQEQTTTDKEEPTTAEQEQTTTDKEKPTTAEQEQTTTDKEEPTTAEQEQTTTNKEEPTTAEQEQTTTDKEEPTTAEQEQTTTDKEEPTTAEQEQTTTDKEEPTTAEQEQTTTDKEEPTTAEQEQTTTDKEESTTAEQEQTTTDKEEPTTAEQEKLPSVLTFDGKDDFIDCGSGINLTNTSFTIEFWAKRQTVGKWHMILFQGEQQKHQGLHIGFRNSDVFTLAFYGDDLNTGQYTDSDWHHWSCVYNHERQQQIIYCDGELEACRQPANYQGTGNLYIGALKGTSAFFEGQLADLRIWQGVRTPQEIQDAMNSRLTGNESGLLAYWPLDEGKGTTITDKTGNGNDGKITGAVWEKMEIPFEDAASSLNKPIEITVNGEKEYIDIPSYSALNLIDDFYIRFKWGVAKIEKDDIKINMKIRRS